MLVGPHNQSEYFGEEIKSLAPARIQNLDNPTHTVATILSMLFQHLIMGKQCVFQTETLVHNTLKSPARI